MDFQKFEMSLIIPFQYDGNCYNQLFLQEESLIREDFVLKDIHPARLNPLGRAWLTDEDGALVRCHELKAESRRAVGLHYNLTHTYRIRKQDVDIRFHIENIRSWFFGSGRAFLTVHITSDSLTGDQVLDLKNLLTGGGKNKISYIVSDRQEEAVIQTERKFTISDLAERLIGLMENIGAAASRGMTYGKLYSLVYGAAVGISDTDKLAFLENLRLNIRSHIQGDTPVDPQFHYGMPNRRIDWTVSEYCMAMLGDAGNHFLVDRGGLCTYVFRDYLILYLYYLSILLEYNDIKVVYQKLQTMPEKVEIDRRWIDELLRMDSQLEPFSNQSHINDLFLKYLCQNTWDIGRKIEELRNEYLPKLLEYSAYDIFISYRRDGGFYLARLLYEILERRGKHPFLDVERLESGRFDEKIYDVIGCCQNVVVVLSPGSLDRCSDEEDWVRKEITYALKNHKTVIPVLADNFKFPEQLPDEIDDIRMLNGVQSTPQSFHETIRKLISFLK